MTNKYRYPKGTPKAGQFMDAKQGAKLFVRENFDNISSGELKVKNLSPIEKKIYAGLKGSDFGNRFTFGKNKYYDPSGTIFPKISTRTNGSRDLKNFYSEPQFREIFDQFIAPVSDEKNRTFILGKFNNLKNYKKQNGKLLDVVKLTNKYRKLGYELIVINKEGERFYNSEATEQLISNELQVVETAKNKKSGSNPFVRIIIDYKIKFNPYEKIIEIDLKDSIENDLSNTP